jgi:hypothetical protein
MRSEALQANLKTGRPGDVYEQEEDRVADAVMRMPEPGVQRQPENEEEGEMVQTKTLADQITPLVQKQEDPVQAKFKDGEIQVVRRLLQRNAKEFEATLFRDGVDLADHVVAKKSRQTTIQLQPADKKRARYLRVLQRIDPFSVPESEICQTREFKSYVSPSGVYRKDMKVTEPEALLACRLILVDISAGPPPNWKTQARVYITEARRRLSQKLPEPEKGGKTFLQTLYALQDSPAGAFDPKLIAGTLKATLPVIGFRELHAFLSDPVRKNVVTRKLGAEAGPLLAAMLNRQHAIIIERYNKYHKAYAAGKDPAGIMPWVTRTGVFDSKDNPFWNITRKVLKAVYNASLTSGSEPSVLLALWKKEGTSATSNKNIKSGVDVGSPVSMKDYDPSLGLRNMTVQIKTPAQARSYVRSRIYYLEFGSDHFTAFKRVPDKDNILDPDLDKHDPAMAAAMSELVKAGYLRRDLSVAVINNELAVATRPDGGFKVEPTQKFYELSLELNSAYFQYLKGTKFPELGNKSPSTVLNYAHWNMGTASFKENLLKWGKKQSGFTGTKLEDWILQRPPDPPPKGQVRRNIIRFGIYERAYRLLFKNGNGGIKF